MLTLIKKIFIWWNQDTFGTRLKTIFFGKFVGKDEFGNKYYQSKNGKRWVIYSGEIDASKIPVALASVAFMLAASALSSELFPPSIIG